jgi:hypothetical protein
MAIAVPVFPIYLKKAAPPMQSFASALTEDSRKKVGKQHQAESKKDQKE